MSFKQYMVLFFLFMGYLVLGAYMFYSIERPIEEERRAALRVEALEIKELLRQHYAAGVPEEHLLLLTRLSDYCGKPFYVDRLNSTWESEDRGNSTRRRRRRSADDSDDDDDDDDDEEYDEDPFIWTFYNALLFVICTISTIGYGNIAPSTRHGRVLDVVYGLFGIPFMGIVLSQMADYFGKIFLRAHHRYKSHEYQTRLSLLMDILTYMGLGMVIFIFFPAAIFVYFEEWTFDTGVYYAFITLATIGYGDLVAGQHKEAWWVYSVYRIMVLVWIMFGLGYMLMIVSFLTRIMKSKKVRKIEHKLAYTIKQTRSKIWNEFSQDVTFLRRMLNEMYLMKIQPVYIEKETEDDKEGVRRVKSCPNLTEWPVLRKIEELDESSSEEDEEEMQEKFKKIAMHRRKGNAENLLVPRVKKVVSESDLSRIDRNATFGEDSGSVEPTLLLAKVVDALGSSIGSKFSLDDKEVSSRKVSQKKLNGIHGFSDEEILASERPQSRWSLAGLGAGGGRKRTVSERHNSGTWGVTGDEEESRTWGGVNPIDIKKFIKSRANGELKRKSISHAVDSRSINSISSTSSSDAGLRVPTSRMRRMSLAVVNLFSPTSKNKSQEIREQKEKELRNSKRSRKTGNTRPLPTIHNGKRLSLPGEEQDHSMFDQVNYLSQTGGRRGSVFAALASEMSPKDSNIPISPVLEQTSVADFLRLLTSLQVNLDPTLSMLPGVSSNIQTQNVGRRKSVSNMSRDLSSNPLAMLFTNMTTANGVQPSGGPANIPHSGQRRISAAKMPNFLDVKGMRGRRFSLIPPMDVDHPSGQVKNKDILRLRKMSTSSHNMIVQNDGSNTSIPSLQSHSLTSSRRTSLAGTARYINAKFQGLADAQKNAPLTYTPTKGFRKFSVRPVPSPDIPPASIRTQKTSNASVLVKPVVPTITIDNCDDERASIKDVEDDEQLSEVFVSKL